MLLAQFLEEILCLMWNQEVLYHFDNILLLDSILSHLNPVHTLSTGVHTSWSPWQLNFACCYLDGVTLYLWILSTECALSHPSVTQNFEVVPRYMENFVYPYPICFEIHFRVTYICTYVASSIHVFRKKCTCYSSPCTYYQSCQTHPTCLITIIILLNTNHEAPPCVLCPYLCYFFVPQLHIFSPAVSVKLSKSVFFPQHKPKLIFLKQQVCKWVMAQ